MLPGDPSPGSMHSPPLRPMTPTSMSTAQPRRSRRRPDGRLRRVAAWLHARRARRRGCCWPGRSAWMILAYLGSLFILLLGAFWAKDSFTGQVEPFVWSLDAFEEHGHQPGVPDDRAADDRHRRGRDRDRRASRVPDRVLHGARRIAADARHPARGHPPAAVGGVPRQGLRLARDPPGQRHPRVGADPVRRRGARASGSCSTRGSCSATSGCRT